MQHLPVAAAEGGNRIPVDPISIDAAMQTGAGDGVQAALNDIHAKATPDLSSALTVSCRRVLCVAFT